MKHNGFETDKNTRVNLLSYLNRLLRECDRCARSVWVQAMEQKLIGPANDRVTSHRPGNHVYHAKPKQPMGDYRATSLVYHLYIAMVTAYAQKTLEFNQLLADLPCPNGEGEYVNALPMGIF